MKNFIKGLFVGIFNIIPGLSGSALLIALGLYEQCIESIADALKKPKKSFIFLLPIGLGIIIGTYSFSNVISFLLNNYSTETYIVFTFLLLGTVPNLFKEAIKKGFNKKYLIPFFITFLIGLLMLSIKNTTSSYIVNYELTSYLRYFSIGAILSISTIIPGISSTIMLSLFNLYNTYIHAISSFDLYILIPILIGFSISTFILSKIIEYLLKNYYGYTYFSILGFTLSTLPNILKVPISINSNFFISIIIGIIAFFITNYLFRVIE